ncbi:MAG TPA: sodium:solute symporter family protein [Hyphomicrobiaceae bacterium]|nr:sodium:solute symporter family protein [Hyphomicrobiaceae bacterium]
MLGVIGYVLIQFAIGVWVSRRIKTNADFVIAGRTLGVGLVAFSVYATFFGAEAIVGTAGSVYEDGLKGGQADPFGYGIAILIVALVFAVPLWRRGIITFADFFRQRYSPFVEKLVVIVLLPGSIFWAAAQVRAFGQIVSSATDLSVTTAIVVAAFVVIGYSVLGGLLADAWTDFVQGLAIVIGLLVLAIVVASELGGFEASLARVEPERFRTISLEEGGLLGFLEGLAIPICGTVVAVEIISRVLGARSAEIARNGAFIGGIMYLAVGLIPVYLGLVGPGLVAELDHAEQIVPQLAEKLLPTLLYIAFAGAVISAILSTIDSVLLASSAQVAHNIWTAVVPAQSDRGQLLTTRLTLVALGMVAFAISLTYERVSDMVEIASAAGSAGVFVAAVFGLFTRFGGALAATAAIVVGALSWLLLGAVLELNAPYLAALTLALGCYVAVAAAERRRTQA